MIVPVQTSQTDWITEIQHHQTNHTIMVSHFIMFCFRTIYSHPTEKTQYLVILVWLQDLMFAEFVSYIHSRLFHATTQISAKAKMIEKWSLLFLLVKNMKNSKLNCFWCDYNRTRLFSYNFITLSVLKIRCNWLQILEEFQNFNMSLLIQ